MALPLIYNLESVRVRWASTLVAVLGIAGTVGVFVAMLALARGFQAALVTSGSERQRDGAPRRRHLGDGQRDHPRAAPRHRGLAGGDARRGRAAGQPGGRGGGGAASRRRRAPTPTCSSAASPCSALAVHDKVKIVDGPVLHARALRAAVGKNAKDAYRGLGLGDDGEARRHDWKVVGSSTPAAARSTPRSGATRTSSTRPTSARGHPPVGGGAPRRPTTRWRRSSAGSPPIRA